MATLSKKPSKFVTNKNQLDVSILERKAREFLCRQQEAKDWIEDMTKEKLPPGTANFTDSLKDGVFLCLLAQSFMPGSVTKIHKPKIGSVLEFMATDNYNQFFRACDRVQFPKIYMFEVTDLWEKKNIINVYKVVHCLHTLAHFLAQRGKGVKIKNLSKANLEFDEEEIRKTKEELQKLEETAEATMVFVMPDEEEQKLIPSVPVDVESEEEPSQDLADPDKTTVVGEGAKTARAGEEASFIIQAKDSSDENLTTGGEVFTVVLFHKTDSSVKVVANVKDNSDGTYAVKYTPEKQGEYSMEIHLIDEAEKKGDDVDEDGEVEEEDDNKLLLKGCPMLVTVASAKTSDPSKCEIAGLGAETAVAGVQTSFTIQGFDKFGNKTSEAENLKAVLVGTTTKTATQVEATVNYEGSGLYTVSYTCPMSGEYRLDVNVNGTQLKSKKIIVKDAGISDPSSSVVEIPTELLSKPIKAGETIAFSIQAKDKHGNDRNSGGEQFTVKIVDANGSEVQMSANEIADSNDGKYAVKVATEKAGNFKLHVVLNGKDLSGSPITVQIADTGATDPSTSVLTCDQDYKTIKAGENRTLSIEARDKFGNKRKLNENEQFIMVAVSKEKKEQLITPPATLNEQTGKYDISFHLEDADEHALQIVLVTKEESGDKSENIQGFPCDIKIVECGKTDPSKTVFEGEGLKRAVANQPAKFTIHAHDLYKNPRRSGGDDVQVTLINPKRNLTFTAEVTDIEDGTYEVNYLPTTSGQYQVVVTINGQQVVTEQLPKDTLSLIVEAPPAKEISENELDTIHDHDLLNSLVNSFHVEQDNENLVEEIQGVREELIKQIKTNSSVEIGLKDVERKIQNLVNNRLQLEELISQRGGGLFGRKNKASTEKPEKNSLLSNQKKMENYGKLFYLLQTDPAYLSKCLYLVPPEKVDKFLETVILTLYGYAFSAREEYLILNLFKMTLQLEVSKSRRLGSFLNNNPVLPKMVMTYGRRVQGQQFLQKVLFDKILSKILNDKDLNLELNAVKLLKEHISKEEVRTGVKSTVNLRDLTFQKAMEDETVSKLVNERIAQLTQICQMILDGIIENVSEIPYGLRWVCKQLDQLLQEKHRDSTEAERASVVGYIAYYRFMNPAIVSPDFFGLTKKNQKISMNMRNNLVIVSKVLTNLANGVLFDAKIEPQMTLMNDWIKKNQKVYVEQFTRGLTSVGDPEEALGVHQFLELTQKKAPAITITWNELFSTHSLLVKYLPKLLSGEANDPLKKIVDELGDAPPELPDEKNEEITLALVSNVVKVDKVQEVTPEQLYETTKDAFRYVLKSLPADNLGENVLDTLDKAKKHANDRLKTPVKVQEGGESQQQVTEKANLTLAKIKAIEEALPKLEEAQILSKANQYRKLLVDITKEIQNQKIIRQKQRKDLERLKESLKSLQTHHKYLEERVQQYQAYVKDIHTSMFDKEAQNAKRRRISKKKVKDKHKFTYKQLKEKGVIVDLNVMSSQKKNIGFCISMPNPGMFDVEAQLAGMTVKTISLTLDELLEKQSKATSQISLDNVVLDVNMTLHLVNKLFANV